MLLQFRPRQIEPWERPPSNERMNRDPQELTTGHPAVSPGVRPTPWAPSGRNGRSWPNARGLGQAMHTYGLVCAVVHAVMRMVCLGFMVPVELFTGCGGFARWTGRGAGSWGPPSSWCHRAGHVHTRTARAHLPGADPRACAPKRWPGNPSLPNCAEPRPPPREPTARPHRPIVERRVMGVVTSSNPLTKKPAKTRKADDTYQ